jgi:hypothetical protein
VNRGQEFVVGGYFIGTHGLLFLSADCAAVIARRPTSCQNKSDSLSKQRNPIFQRNRLAMDREELLVAAPSRARQGKSAKT